MLINSILIASGFVICSLISAGMLRPIRITRPF
jgi:hypothetical protein